MNTQNQHLDALQDIKKMMERSSRFISLSGLSGIAAGGCALIGAWFARQAFVEYAAAYKSVGRGTNYKELFDLGIEVDNYDFGTVKISEKYLMLQERLMWIGITTFIAAFILAFLFTWLRSKKEGIGLWGKASKRLMFNVAIPMIVGGIFILKLFTDGYYIGFVAPSCLIFYGLALVHASKYTLGEVRFLGFGQIILGLINLWFIGYGLYFWAAGFGILHILYGAIMWWKYERN